MGYRLHAGDEKAENGWSTTGDARWRPLPRREEAASTAVDEDDDGKIIFNYGWSRAEGLVARQCEREVGGEADAE